MGWPCREVEEHGQNGEIRFEHVFESKLNWPSIDGISELDHTHRQNVVCRVCMLRFNSGRLDLGVLSV